MGEIPKGLQTYFLKETESEDYPVIRKEGNTIIIPIFIRETTKTDEAGEKTLFRFFEVETEHKGQSLTDYNKCCLQSYAAIRKSLYGDASAQGEMRDDKIWEAHRLAVRAAFPKYLGEAHPQQDRFDAIKDGFWEIIVAALETIGKTRSDLPSYFNAEEMLAWAQANGMDAATIQTVAAQIEVLSLDLLHNNRNWSELFD